MKTYDLPKLKVLPPGPNAQNAIDQDNTMLSTSLSRQYGLVASRAHGPYVEDVDGNVFLDLGRS
jgi:4-aminobutyrate aminotransferase